MLTTAVTNNNATLTVSGARGAWNDADMLETVTEALILMFLLEIHPKLISNHASIRWNCP